MFYLRIAILVLFSILLQSCDKGKQSNDIQVIHKQKARNIAVFIPMSGPYKKIGRSIQNVIEMAVFYNNSQNITFSFYDTNQLSQELSNINFKEVDAIVGPVFSKYIAPIKAYAKRHNIIILSLSNDSTKKDKNVFIFGIDPARGVANILDFATNKEVNSILSIVPDNNYGQIVCSVLDNYARNNHKLTFTKLTYNRQVTNLADQVAPLSSQSLDCVFVPEGGKSLARVISSLHQHEIDTTNTTFLGTEQWDDDKSYQIISINGAYISTPKSKQYKNFAQKYYSLYNNKPAKIAGVAYDLVNMLFSIMHLFPVEAISTTELISDVKFYGVYGNFFLQSDSTVNRSHSIARVTTKGIIYPVTRKKMGKQ